MTGILDGLTDTIGSQVMSSAFGQMNQSLSAHRNARLDYETWKKKFDYSYSKHSPLAQRRRLEEAGLNPALMYQGGTGAGLSTSIGQSSVSSQPVDSTVIQRLENETKLADAQSAYYNSLAEGQGNENRTFDERFAAQMEVLKQQARKDESIADLNALEAIVANATGTARIEEAYALVEKLKADTDLSRKTIEEITSNIALKQSTILLNKALAKKAESDIEVNEQQVQYLIAQTKFTYSNEELTIALKGKAEEETYRLKCTHEEYQFLLHWQGLLAQEQEDKTDSERRLINKQAAWYDELTLAQIVKEYGGSIAELLKGSGSIMKAIKG